MPRCYLGLMIYAVTADPVADIRRSAAYTDHRSRWLLPCSARTAIYCQWRSGRCYYSPPSSAQSSLRGRNNQVEIGLTHYLVLSAVLFCIGLYGALTRRNAVIILMCIEMMLNAVNISHGGVFQLYRAAAADRAGICHLRDGRGRRGSCRRHRHPAGNITAISTIST